MKKHLLEVVYVAVTKMVYEAVTKTNCPHPIDYFIFAYNCKYCDTLSTINVGILTWVICYPMDIDINRESEWTFIQRSS